MPPVIQHAAWPLVPIRRGHAVSRPRVSRVLSKSRRAGCSPFDTGSPVTDNNPVPLSDTVVFSEVQGLSPSTMPRDEVSMEGSSSSQDLACTSCRSRKLKCDRIKPACTRCARVKSDCVYPESRRKPAFKRRNVRELEARLAQVEDLLKQNEDKEPAKEKTDEVFDFNFADFTPSTEDVFLQGMDYTIPSPPLDSDPMFSMPSANASSMPFSSTDDTQNTGAAFGGELFGLGMSESLPPFELTEDLIFFDRQQHFIPVIHPARYFQAYYSAPHMKPAMCLQYAIWALASNGHEQYGQMHDVFYQRARQYAEADELKGHGEHFITVQHAQAWSLIATDEAKSMLFTRAAMSSARAIRLAHMMALHRLDSSPEDLSPTLMPPKDWAELEERRRTFWGIFCLDSHCSVSTGWPHLIDASEVTTHLPASESAFVSGQAVETCALNEAFKGPSYSSFAGAILVCHLFNIILKHVHRPKPDDNPQNYEYGEYWQRHRDIDNTVSSAFMFLPEHFRLPENYRDSTAVHTNLNYHASLICLHLAALEKIEEYKLPDYAKRASESRLFTAAQEIVNIIKMTSHLKTNPRSPMAAISLYCAASVYIYQLKETKSAKNSANLDFIITAMDAIGRQHMITRAFLKQLLLDIEQNEITEVSGIPKLVDLPRIIAVGNHNIPLLTRSQTSKHSPRQPPLPGRLPLGNPQGNINNSTIRECGIGFGYTIKDNGQGAVIEENSADKQRQKSLLGFATSSTSLCDFMHQPNTLWEPTETTPSSDSTPPESQGTRPDPFASFQRSPWASLTRGITNKLPVRTGSPATTSAAAPRAPIPTQSSMNTDANLPPSASSGTPGANRPGFLPNGVRDFDPSGVCIYSQSSNTSTIANGTEVDPWAMAGQSGNVDWDAIATSAGINMADFPDVLNTSPQDGSVGGGANPG
ncbi:hypothetical protein SCUP234_10531 [Seiridium cupressi]